MHNPFHKDKGFRVPMWREVWIHDTNGNQLMEWWFLACGANTLHASMQLDTVTTYPLDYTLHLRRLPRAPLNFFLHIFIPSDDAANCEKLIRLIPTIPTMNWTGVCIHALFNGTIPTERYTLRVYRSVRAIRSAWDRWGSDGRVDPFPDDSNKRQTTAAVDESGELVKRLRI